MIRRMETSNRKSLFEISSWNRFLNRSLKLVSESVLKPIIETVTGDFLGPRGLFESRAPPLTEKHVQLLYRPRLNTGDPSQPNPNSTLVSIIHSPPQEIVVTGLTSFTNQVNL